MRKLGLIGLAVACGSLSACQTSEPARATPPGTATGVAASPAPGPSPVAPDGARVYDETVQNIDVAPGGRFTIALSANMSTPLEWKLEPEPNPAVLAAAGRRYTDAPPPGCSGCVGYPGTDAFTFEAKGPGEAALHFAYRELKKDAPPAKELTVRVRVSGP